MKLDGDGKAIRDYDEEESECTCGTCADIKQFLSKQALLLKEYVEVHNSGYYHGEITRCEALQIMRCVISSLDNLLAEQMKIEQVFEKRVREKAQKIYSENGN